MYTKKDRNWIIGLNIVTAIFVGCAIGFSYANNLFAVLTETELREFAAIFCGLFTLFMFAYFLKNI